MPNLKSLKSIVEKMKNLSHALTVTANNDGRMALKIKTNMVSLGVHFTELNVKSFAGKNKDHLMIKITKSF